MATDLPRHDQLADDTDELDWDREQHGRMVDAATGPEGEPPTRRLTFDTIPEA